MKTPSLSGKAPSPFAKLLIALMREHGIGVREAARIAGVPTSTVGDWRSGRLPRDFAAVRRLAEALGTSLSFLLTGEPDVASTTSSPNVAEVFDTEKVVFDGYARVRIERLVPRKKKRTPAVSNLSTPRLPRPQ